MTTTPGRNGLHPMLWVAAASVTAVSLAGVAKLTGILPDSDAHKPAPEAITAAPAPRAEPTPPLASAAAPVEATPPEAAPASSKPAVAEHKPAAPKPTPKPHPKAAVASHPATTPAPVAAPPDAIPAPPPPPAQRVTAVPPVCHDCGVIERVDAIEQKGEGSGIGAVGGAILGGVLGHQVGEGSGKKLARIGGAVLGGFAGNEVEKRTRSATHYQVTVRMEDGTRRVIDQQTTPVWRQGDPVRIRNGEIVAGGGHSAPSRGNTDF